jgi:HSP20 family molecular chaperone IbpA
MILPDNVDSAKISAKVENGVLMVDIPKLPVEHAKMLEKEIVVQ